MPHIWTRALVCESIENVFRGRGGAFGRTAGDVERLLNYPLRVPGLDPDEWRMLLLRSECRAAGESVDERRRAFGVTPSRFEAGWRRVADMIAAGLNVERLNRAQLIATERAEENMTANGRFSPGSDPPVTLGPRRRQPA